MLGEGIVLGLDDFQVDGQITRFKVPHRLSTDWELQASVLSRVNYWCGPGIERKFTVYLAVAHRSEVRKATSIVKEHFHLDALSMIAESHPGRMVINMLPLDVLF
jgi:hypothetical protein